MLSSVLGYSLVGIATLEFALAIASLSSRQRQSNGAWRWSVFVALLTTSLYCFFAGLSYLRCGAGKSYAVFYNLCWIGFAGMPATIEILLRLNSDRKPWKIYVARSLYVCWGVIVYLAATTDLIEVAPATLIPYVDVVAPYELAARGFAALQIIYIIVAAVRAGRNAKGLNKSRVGYLALGLSLYAFAGLVASTVVRVPIDPALTSAFSVFFAIPVAYATTHQRLLDLRLLISKLLVVLASTATFTVLDYIAFSLFSESVPSSVALVLAAAVVSAVVFLTPVASWIRDGLGFLIRGRRLSHREILGSFNELMLQTQNVDDLLRGLGCRVQVGLGVTSYAVFLADDARLRLRVGELVEGDMQVSPVNAYEISAGPLRERIQCSTDVLLREEVALVSDNAKSDLVCRQIFESLERAGRYELLLPLVRKGELLGLLCLGAKGDGGAFTVEDIDLLRTLGTQLALSMENARLFSESVEDGLTGLFHQKYFKARLTSEVGMARRHARPMGLLFIDVDHFKAVNDTHGHVTGDAVLARLASILRSSFRSSDVVARYGGEEFAVLLVDPDPDQIVAIAERVRERIARETIAGRLRVTVSIGVYISPAGDPVTTLPISTLLERADSALYKAKHGGRNRVVLYEAEPHTGLSLAS